MRPQLTMSQYADILSFLTSGTVPEGVARANRSYFCRQARKYEVGEDGRLYWPDERGRKLEVIAKDDLVGLRRVFHSVHDRRHLGMTKMFQRMRLLYTGFLRSTIDDMVRSCPTCQSVMPPSRDAPIRPITAQRP